jgi:hypothetical protein
MLVTVLDRLSSGMSSRHCDPSRQTARMRRPSFDADSHQRKQLGDYYTIDMNRNQIVDGYTGFAALTALANKLGALNDWEELSKEQLT